MTDFRSLFMAASLTVAAMLPVAMLDRANAATPEDLSRDGAQALQLLYDKSPAAHALSQNARAVLVFPSIVKAGLVFGAAYGEGVLKQASKTDTYYNSFTGSWGLQAGAQSYGYAVFLMTNKAVSYLDRSDGWEIGVGPTVVVVNRGEATNLSTSTLKTQIAQMEAEMCQNTPTVGLDRHADQPKSFGRPGSVGVSGGEVSPLSKTAVHQRPDRLRAASARRRSIVSNKDADGRLNPGKSGEFAV